MGRIYFACKSQRDNRVTHTLWHDTQIASGGLQASDAIDGLIGRDILSSFDLSYNGKTGKVSMRFLKS